MYVTDVERPSDDERQSEGDSSEQETASEESIVQFECGLPPDLVLKLMDVTAQSSVLSVQSARRACDTGLADVQWFIKVCGLRHEQQWYSEGLFYWATGGSGTMTFRAMIQVVYAFSQPGDALERARCLWSILNPHGKDTITPQALLARFTPSLQHQPGWCEDEAVNAAMYLASSIGREDIGFMQFAQFITEYHLAPTIRLQLVGHEKLAPLSERIWARVKADRFKDVWVTLWAMACLANGLRMGIPFTDEATVRVFSYGVAVSRFSAGMLLINVPLLYILMASWLVKAISTTPVVNVIPVHLTTHLHIHLACHVLFDLILHIGGHMSNFIHAGWATTEDLNRVLARRVESTSDFGLFNTQVGLTGILLTITFVAMGFASHHGVRRKNHPLFYWVHRLFWVNIIVFTLHGQEGWLLPPAAHWYMLPGLIIFLIEQGLAARGWFHSQRCHFAIHSKTTLQLSWPYPGSYIPGQYVRVLVPSVSWWDAHPYSVSSAPNSGVMGVHMRCNGKWSTRVLQAFRENKDPSVRIFGPYGAPCLSALRARGPVVLIGCGIGATPFSSILPWLVRRHQRDVHFHGIAPTFEGFEWIFSSLASAQEEYHSRGYWLSVSLYATREHTTWDNAVAQALHSLRGRSSSNFVAHGIQRKLQGRSSIFCNRRVAPVEDGLVAVSAHHVALVRASWSTIMDHYPLFHQRLHSSPELLHIFQKTVVHEMDHVRLMLHWIVNHLDDIPALRPALQHLGRSHGEYNVSSNSYIAFGKALGQAVSAVLSAADGVPEASSGLLSPVQHRDEVEAWMAVYDYVTSVMQCNQNMDSIVLDVDDFRAEPEGPGGFTTFHARPDWGKVLSMYRVLYPGEEIEVFFCGNEGVGVPVLNACQEHSKYGGTTFRFTREVF